LLLKARVVAEEQVHKGAKPRVSPGEFVRQVRSETAKVVWPSRKETIQTTILVLIMTSILALFFLGIDQVLGRAVKFLLDLGV
jgi:preprotein translocase subunit SecE